MTGDPAHEAQNGRMEYVRVRDVAERAGVSAGTMANFFHKPELVAQATAERIQRAIDDLGYVPNLAARSLRRRATGIIGSLSFERDNPYSASFGQAVDDAAREAGFAVIGASSGGDLERQTAYLDLLVQHRVDGLLLSPLHGSERAIEALSARRTPVVIVDKPELAPGLASVSTVSVDDVVGARHAGEHLLQLGHRHIMFAGADEGIDIIERRISGLREALSSHPDARLIVIGARQRSIAGGREIGNALAAMPAEDRPTAVLAVNDLLGVGILHGVHGRLTVPGDLSIIGFDDIAFAAEALVPLTTVARPVEPFAQRAVELLSALIHDPQGTEHVDIMLPAELVVRRSTGAPNRR